MADKLSVAHTRVDADSRICVVVPLYKDKLDSYEAESLAQCLRVLGPTHDIALLCGASFNGDTGSAEGHKFVRFERFADAYFSSRKTYSELCASPDFYARFEKYTHILIYQLDGYVFRDDLCDKWVKYDYVGAPWCMWCSRCSTAGCSADRVGNGGVSLRNVRKCCEVARRFRGDALPEDVNVFSTRNPDARALYRPSCLEALEFSLETCPARGYAVSGVIPSFCHNLVQIDNNLFKRFKASTAAADGTCLSVDRLKRGVTMRWMRKSDDSHGLYDLVAYTGRDHIVMVEVGSYAGESASMFLATGKVDRIYCVDPWSPGYDASDLASDAGNLLAAEREFDSRFSADPRVVKVKSTVQDAISSGSIPAHVDMVYIDGCHQYDCVCADIRAVIGLCDVIAGHDYWSSNVIRAVRDTLGCSPARTFSDSSWVVPLSGRIGADNAVPVVKWGEYFDKVVLLHYAPYANRMPRMVSELSRVGLLGSDVFRVVTARPIRGLSAERNLSFYTARAIDDFLAGGGDRICLLENDIAFLKDLTLLDRILAESPHDGVVQFDKFPPGGWARARYETIVRENRIGADFFRNPGVFIAGGSFYALNRTAAESMMVRLLSDARFPDNNFTRLGCPVYVADTNAAVQVMYKDGVAASRWCTRDGVRVNSHTEAYTRMGLHYADYAVPFGYTETSLYYDPEEGK